MKKLFIIGLALALTLTGCTSPNNTSSVASTTAATTTTAATAAATQPTRPAIPPVYGTALRSAGALDPNTDPPKTFAAMFYSDVDALGYINERIADHDGPGEEYQKRAFTGYTALPTDFTIYNGGDPRMGPGSVVAEIAIDADDPFFTTDEFHGFFNVPLSPQVSPYGQDFTDVSWTDTGIPFAYDKNYANDDHLYPDLLIPMIRLDNGDLPKVDTAVNAAIQAMVPTLQKAGFSAYPHVNVKDRYISIVYQERETSSGDGGSDYSAAVPGCALLWDIGKNQAADINAVIAAHTWLYALLTGDLNEYFPGETGDLGRWCRYFPAIDGYTPPDGSVYSDLYIDSNFNGYVMTLTQPDGQRLLMAEDQGQFGGG